MFLPGRKYRSPTKQYLRSRVRLDDLPLRCGNNLPIFALLPPQDRPQYLEYAADLWTDQRLRFLEFLPVNVLLALRLSHFQLGSDSCVDFLGRNRRQLQMQRQFGANLDGATRLVSHGISDLLPGRIYCNCYAALQDRK